MNVELVTFGKKYLKNSRLWMNDKEICRLFNRVYKPLSAVQQKKWYANLIKDSTQLIKAIEVNGTYVGNVGLKNIDYLNNKAEFYILIGAKNYWSKGIGTISTKKFLIYIKNKLPLHKIYLHVNQSNLRAIKLYQKTNFKKEGALKDELFRENKYITMIRMAYFITP
ncbi:MAG TPA: hypothetical protein DDX47_00465 [Candidatus Jacksonbacteria bacterium]|nr:MAG: GCN5-like protein N-acetyltransferase [Parcubacteria group bacterium GW2011_GWC2_44_22]OGY76458.1 MAG: hypothetical protein A2295_02290 [Candidatus Jacksonbacteria bacterium RIFOXYB2_FULL_44_15]OGY76829.1 MAG: hypothetical protein A2240_04625 [Candidatus Jacksonbacteria bacterium RIFOXYA2_FULL_43_12]OGY82188.1 MAG: hypothetical protein A2550_05795 [Candidatus Jacksonbacteria bacterium RIFOXYD2_FULL_43_21]HBH45829.1 hypothetical protein [Candidatus Jacksonbacteria bacterium]